MYRVDDVPEPRELIRFGMEEDPGFEVGRPVTAGALEGISATQRAAVLLDLSMPTWDGLEAIPETAG